MLLQACKVRLCDCSPAWVVDQKQSKDGGVVGIEQDITKMGAGMGVGLTAQESKNFVLPRFFNRALSCVHHANGDGAVFVLCRILKACVAVVADNLSSCL